MPVPGCPNKCPLLAFDGDETPRTKLAPPAATRIPDIHEVAKSVYRPLATGQTRMLSLTAGSQGDNLVTKLYTVTLEPNKARSLVLGDIVYTALSYAWGTLDRTCILHLDGFCFPITLNLWNALQRLRSASGDRYLWVDAICINQCNTAERSQQVTMMTTIYRSASIVIAWLGDYEDHSVRALNALTYSSTHFAGSAKREHHVVCRETVGLGLQDLYSRPWLSRLWVRREVWAARKLMVMCGSHQLSRQQYRNSPSIEFKKEEHLLVPLLSLDSLVHLPPPPRGTVRPRYLDDPTDIVDALRGNVQCRSTDPRDRVYALLDMTTASPASGADQQPRIPVDYSRSVVAVFVDVARYVILREGSLSVLYLDAHFGGSSDDTGQPDPSGEEIEERDLPSWCPDWRLATGTKAYGGIIDQSIIPQLQRLDISTRSPPNGIEITSFDDSNPKRLILHGLHYGTFNSFSKLHRDLDRYYLDTEKLYALNPGIAGRMKAANLLKHASTDNKSLFDDSTDACGIHRRLRDLAAETDVTTTALAAWVPAATAQEEVWYVPTSTQEGDLLVYVAGGVLPLIIRRHPSTTDEYTFVGSALCARRPVPLIRCPQPDVWRALVYALLRILLKCRERQGTLRTFTLV